MCNGRVADRSYWIKDMSGRKALYRRLGLV